MDRWLFVIVLIFPPFLALVVIFGVLKLLFVKYPDKGKYVGLSIFTKILYYSFQGCKKRLYFLELRITNSKLAKKLYMRLGYLVGLLVTLTFNVLFPLLLLEITKKCTEGFHCYDERNAETADCEADRNASLSVICYRFTFSPFLATGVAYGVFKVGVAASYFCSLFFLWLYKNHSSKAKWICMGIEIVLLVGIIVVPIVLYYIFGLSFVDIIKGSYIFPLATVVFGGLHLGIPWSQLVKIPTPDEDFDDTESVNPQENKACDESLGAPSGQVGEDETQRLQAAGDRNVNPQENKACDKSLDVSSCELGKGLVQRFKPARDRK